MLHMCANDHEPIIFDGDNNECPLCESLKELEYEKGYYLNLKENTENTIAKLKSQIEKLSPKLKE